MVWHCLALKQFYIKNVGPAKIQRVQQKIPGCWTYAQQNENKFQKVCRSWDICYESVNGRTNGQTRWLQYSPLSMRGGIINIKSSLIDWLLFNVKWAVFVGRRHKDILPKFIFFKFQYTYIQINIKSPLIDWLIAV